MSERHDVWKLADAMQMDLRAAQAKLVEMRSILAGMNLPEPSTLRCQCGLSFKGPRTLSEHVHTSHGGPLPDHWLAVDELAADPVDPSVQVLEGEPTP